MTWTYILILAAIVFFNRYLFLEPRVDIKFPHFFEKMLKYSAPCLLTAICAPIIFYQDDAFRAFANNPYLYGAIFCVLMILWLADSSGKCNSIKTSHNITGRIPSQCLSGAII